MAWKARGKVILTEAGEVAWRLAWVFSPVPIGWLRR